MSKEYSRSDFITDFASARAHADVHERSRLPLSVVPDLRFEPTFMKKIGPYVHVTRANASHTSPTESDPVVRIEWSKVIWITAKDQVISPLLQGALCFYLSTTARRFFDYTAQVVVASIPATSCWP
ncbi:hypothetical protein OF83DRAFT_273642 [Amylostereum chailletii]|nr:hypothetical protein OF83DRAFT_273642 [Amylostereum chailletii]